jgi:hypothetical protein
MIMEHVGNTKNRENRCIWRKILTSTWSTINPTRVILESKEITGAQAARFVLASCEDFKTDGTAVDEFAQAKDKGWLPKTNAEQAITLGSLSFLMMKTFNIRGGMMYAILPGPRCAFRTMMDRSFIQGAADPSTTVSGIRFLQILEKVLNAQGYAS